MRPLASFLLLVLSIAYMPQGLAKPQVKPTAEQKKVAPLRNKTVKSTPKFQKLVQKTTPTANNIAQVLNKPLKVKVKASTKFASFSAIDAHPESDPSFRAMNATDLEESLEVSNPAPL